VGASVYIQARDHDEMRMLESEGAPEFHATYTTIGIALTAIGRGDLDPVGGTIDPEDLPGIISACRAVEALDPQGKGWAIRQIGDVAKAALALNRAISWG